MSRNILLLATLLVISVTTTTFAAPVEVSWFGEIPEGATLTNPSISAGETWSVTYLLDDSIMDSDLATDSGRYEAAALTAMIEFSGGYSAPVSPEPGISLVVIDGGSADIISGVASGFSAIVRLTADTLSGDQFPPDGTYTPSIPVGAPMLTFGNDDGVVLYFDTDGGSISLMLNTIILPGDGNGDGVVNGLDYIVWASNFGADPAPDPPGSPANGDYNEDGKVSGLDYIVWATNFDPSSPMASAVPEPCGALLISALILPLAIARRRGALA